MGLDKGSQVPWEERAQFGSTPEGVKRESTYDKKQSFGKKERFSKTFRKNRNKRITLRPNGAIPGSWKIRLWFTFRLLHYDEQNKVCIKFYSARQPLPGIYSGVVRIKHTTIIPGTYIIYIIRAKRVSNCYMQEKKNWPSVWMSVCSANLGFSVTSANRIRPEHGIPLPV